MKLSRAQGQIMREVFDRLPVGDSVSTLDFALKGEFAGRFAAAYAGLTIDPSVQVVFNIPTYTNHMFLALTRKNEKEVARYLCNMEDYERSLKRLIRPGEVFIAGASTDLSGLPFGVVSLRTESSVDLAGIPDQIKIGELLVAFSLAVPITESEWRHKEMHGHDALIELFESEAKELFFFR